MDDMLPIAGFGDYIKLLFIVILLAVVTIISNVIQNSKRYSKYGSKKFLIALTLIIGTAFLVWDNKLTGSNFSIMNSIIGAAYGAANLTSKKKYDPELTETETLLSRKFLIAETMIAMVLVLGTYGYLTSNEMMGPLLVAGGMFGITNVMSKPSVASKPKAVVEDYDH
jgi:hypothetical protein